MAQFKEWSFSEAEMKKIIDQIEEIERQRFFSPVKESIPHGKQTRCFLFDDCAVLKTYKPDDFSQLAKLYDIVNPKLQRLAARNINVPPIFGLAGGIETNFVQDKLYEDKVLVDYIFLKRLQGRRLYNFKAEGKLFDARVRGVYLSEEEKNKSIAYIKSKIDLMASISQEDYNALISQILEIGAEELDCQDMFSHNILFDPRDKFSFVDLRDEFRQNDMPFVFKHLILGANTSNQLHYNKIKLTPEEEQEQKIKAALYFVKIYSALAANKALAQFYVPKSLVFPEKSFSFLERETVYQVAEERKVKIDGGFLL